MFYAFADEQTIKRAPKPLKVDGKDVFTTNEKIHNEYGFFRLICEDYPKDSKCYKPKYILNDNLIYRSWEEVETELIQSDINADYDNGEAER